MRPFVPFHPAMPDPTPYFKAQSQEVVRKRWLYVATAVGILVSVGMVMYVAGTIIFSCMPIPA